MEEIKLVIWDLDETLWQGVFNEGNVILSRENINLIKTLTNRGIINSICSKNDYNSVKTFLEEKNLWQHFVFPSINWESKGLRVKEIIQKTQFRNENVLFIDDNITNIEEVKYYNSGINCLMESSIPTLLDNKTLAGKNDFEHTRLKQYKLLEIKDTSRKEFNTNEEFLTNCNIVVEIKKNCKDYFERIYELINRTNQLNYTKKRIGQDELEDLLNLECSNVGYITVKDRYGDYGVTGFYSIKNNQLEHFLFSCRILNLGVEQWVYAKLGFPKIEISGTVATQLDDFTIPGWINSESIEMPIESENSINASHNIKCLIKGGCDLSQIVHYFLHKNVSIEEEFNHVTSASLNVHREHSEILRSCFELSTEEKSFLIQNLPFYDNKIFNTNFFDTKNDVVIYSVLIDYTFGLYSYKRNPRITIAYSDFNLPMTDKNNWETIKNRSNGVLDEKFLSWFTDNFEFIGPLTEQRFWENLIWMAERLSKNTILCILNGSETEIDYKWERNRHVHHKKMNSVLNEFALKRKNVYIIDVNKYVVDKSCLDKNIRHYKRLIYKKLALDIENILKEKFSYKASIDKQKIISLLRFLFINSIKKNYIMKKIYRRLKAAN